MKKLFSTLAFIFLFCVHVNAAILPPDQAFSLTSQVDQQNTLYLHWDISPQTYLYKDRFSFKVLSPSKVKLQPVQYPKGSWQDDEIFGHYQVYQDEVTIPLQFSSTKSAVKLQVSYQGCSHAGVCYPPVIKHMTVRFHQVPSIASKPAISVQDNIAQQLASQSFWWTLLSFLGIGLLLAFTPCVLPMIPILSAMIVGQKEKVTAWRGFVLSLVYVLAMSLTYAVAGVVVSLAGQNLQAIFQSPVVIIIFSLLFVLLSLSLFGLYELQLPERLRHRLANINSHQKGGQYIGVALMGILSTLIVSPCVTPPLVGALAYIANTGHVLMGGVALFALGFGMGIPLLVIGALGGKFLPKAGMWMNTVKVLFGFLMLAIAIWLVMRLLPSFVHLFVWGVWLIALGIYLGSYWRPIVTKKAWFFVGRILSVIIIFYGAVMLVGAAMGNSDPLRPLMSHKAANVLRHGEVNFKKVKTVMQVEQALQDAKAMNKPVMLDFYADWCAACKKMDVTVFSDYHIQQSLKHFVLLRADVTANDADDRALEKQFNVIAPPTFLFFDAQGEPMPDATILGEVGTKAFCRHLADILVK